MGAKVFGWAEGQHPRIEKSVKQILAAYNRSRREPIIQNQVKTQAGLLRQRLGDYDNVFSRFNSFEGGEFNYETLSLEFEKYDTALRNLDIVLFGQGDGVLQTLTEEQAFLDPTQNKYDQQYAGRFGRMDFGSLMAEVPLTAGNQKPTMVPMPYDGSRGRVFMTGGKGPNFNNFVPPNITRQQ